MANPARALPGVAALVILIPVVLAGCAGTPTASSGIAADTPSYRVGDRWVYHAQDGFRLKTVWDETHEVTAIGPDGITVRVTQKGPSTDVTRTELWAAPGQLKIGSVYDNEIRRFATPLQAYDFPLDYGKSWSQFVDNYNEFTRKSGQINRYVRVGGWSKVTTGAGTFDAVALQVVMRLDDDTFWRFGTDCNYQVWYAPAIRGIVRAEEDAQYQEKDGAMDGGGVMRIQHATLELVSFTPGRS